MSDSVMTTDEWAALRASAALSNEGIAAWFDEKFAEDDDPSAARIIAALNFRLRDDDPRKITHERVELVRNAARVWMAMPLEDANALEQFADGLESLLPPRSSPPR